MKTLIACLVPAAIAGVILFISMRSSVANEQEGQKSPSVLDMTVTDIDGNECDLSQFRGKVVMIVNVASKCGLTPQYAALEELYREHKDRGFVIIGFPANNFGNQEPLPDPLIKEFCTSTYDVTFPMMSKISVKGDDQHPLYKQLTSEETSGKHAGEIKWNFTKFLLDREGKVIARFEPKTKPSDEAVTDAVKRALDIPAPVES